MTAMNLYLAEARMMELTRARGSGLGAGLRELAAEAVRTLRGALIPVAGPETRLSPSLRRDIGLR